jgi:ATP-dependent Clp protease ATP-binding subunit ClpA
MGASKILKRGLAQGRIQLLAATTAAEYRRAIEKDPDLKR